MQERASITFTPDGSGRCLYHEEIDLQVLGRLDCSRASHVDFNAHTQSWEVSRPGNGPVLFSSPSRQCCLRWEREHLS